jgi:hypothetical protein
MSLGDCIMLPNVVALAQSMSLGGREDGWIGVLVGSGLDKGHIQIGKGCGEAGGNDGACQASAQNQVVCLAHSWGKKEKQAGRQAGRQGRGMGIGIEKRRKVPMHAFSPPIDDNDPCYAAFDLGSILRNKSRISLVSFLGSLKKLI